MSDAQKKISTDIWLWALAFLLMIAAASYQRRTGPTYPLRGQVNVGNAQLKYRLPRSAENTSDAMVSIPDLGVTARLLWRRYPTDEPYTVAFMAPELDGGKRILTARIPSQEIAGKVEYKIEIANSAIPDNGETAIFRFKGPVSGAILMPHILLMFAAMLTSTRAGLGAAFKRGGDSLPWATLGMVLVGGLILGVFVQKAAFGSYWTGWPHGSDITDNKTLLMFAGWLIACLLLPLPRFRRPAIILASVLTLIVYLIPHSLRGTHLDYQQESVQTHQ